MAPNRLGQQFGVSAPNRVWVTDITYVATDEGWVYVTLVMDLFSRTLVGWAIETFVDSRLTLAALRLALGQRHPDAPSCIIRIAGYSMRRLRIGPCWRVGASRSR